MKGKAKIKALEHLRDILNALRSGKRSKRIVHCHGVFDLLHIGHIRYLEQARELGDVLVVTVTPDRYVNKGPHRPAFTESLRAEVLAALDCVDYVAINRWPTAVETIRLLRPDVYAKGAEYKSNRTEEIQSEEAALAASGGSVVFIDDLISSSSYLINRHLGVFSEEVRDYLQGFTERFSEEEILAYLEDLRALKVLVVGEAIVDEYQYCDAIGKSSKEPALAAKYLSTELFAGGALAVSNHIASFCERVDLLTFLGDEESHEDFIREHLKSNVTSMFLYKESAPTILKRRFIEDYFLSKFFEIYIIEERELNEKENRALCTALHERLPDYDVVVVADFGHGMMTGEAIGILCQNAGFLAVNTQVNAGNRGYNTISRYPRADYVCLNETEIRLEMRDQQGDLKDLILRLSQELSCANVLITVGKDGNLCYGRDEGYFQVPAFAVRVVDRIGTGDAVFALSSLCIARQMPLEMVGFVANVAGAEAAAIVGNRSSLERTPLCRHIASLLK